ncbi:major facilitator superfamily domain-containing protein [Leucosporidium creatinivorum]|uniref:Major facilitator superfamily domain-containing protein n=1 Tax=Leucosporidium creatinivorum TaxID=106004 RepID=A0A1Y2FYD1_9BASI|nr:major facilitator superfamily domain-containing protein [Leucosporidium creatinivorum]
MTNFAEVWRSYTSEQKRNIAFYIGGIMFYKLGLEFFNGSITTLATDRFNASNAFTKLGAAQGVNQAAQCVGAILIAPLIKVLPTRTVLAGAVVAFALFTSLIMIIDAATGGHIREPGQKPHYGSWDADAIFPIWGLAGIVYGMVELIRRVIPADIIGANPGKLRRMDATVHVLYEVAGTAGAFASSSAISKFGNNYSFFLSPVFFCLGGLLWTRIGALRAVHDEVDGDEPALAAVEREGESKNYFKQIGRGFLLFFKSIYLGGAIIFSSRAFCWLFTSYAVALYLHRFLESSLAPAFAKRFLGTSAWSQIIVGGSNFGELLGALTVFLLSDYVPTPMPWLRLDALALNIVWVMPTFTRTMPRTVGTAWKLAGCFIPISFGWAAGDVSLAAYIQSTLTAMNIKSKDVSPLGAVMAFLFSSYVVMNAVLSSTLGKVIDKDFVANGNIYKSLQQVGGIQFTVASVIILLSTLIPIGAFAFNPKTISPAVPIEKADEEELGYDKEEQLKKQASSENSHKEQV